MGHEQNNVHLSPEEQSFNEMISRGDDYYRIELWRWALTYYQKAEKMDLQPEMVKEKISLVKDRIRKETRTIIIVVVLALAIIAVIWALT